jgi:hypothetical protein
MRIICDQCDQPISGTVKRVSGILNLHPDCLIDSAEELNTSNLSPRPGKHFSMAALVQWKQAALVPSLASNFK